MQVDMTCTNMNDEEIMKINQPDIEPRLHFEPMEEFISQESIDDPRWREAKSRATTGEEIKHITVDLAHPDLEIIVGLKISPNCEQANHPQWVSNMVLV